MPYYYEPFETDLQTEDCRDALADYYEWLAEQEQKEVEPYNIPNDI